MKIQKLGHCCLLVEIKGKKILTDPGSYTLNKHAKLNDIDIVLITHEHGDHLHVESLKEVIKNNSNLTVISNSSVGKILEENSIEYKTLEGKDSGEFLDILIEAYDGKHEEIFEEIGQVQNTGYFLDEKFFYPGDSYTKPNKDVQVLALPVAGPWCKIPDVIRYALDVKPKIAIPVHDGMIKSENIGLTTFAPGKVLEENNIQFVPMNQGDEESFDV